jgi:enoyl-CoA hydratase
MVAAVLSEVRGGAMWITLNRPDALNAITPDVVSGIRRWC